MKKYLILWGVQSNLFRISQTEEKLKKDNMHGCSEATAIHYEVGSKVRKGIEDYGYLVDFIEKER